MASPKRANNDLTPEEKQKLATEIYTELQKVGDDGMGLANKSAQWSAYERSVESGRDDRLFRDPVSKHLAGERGRRMSETFSISDALHFPDFPEPGEGRLVGFSAYHAARTMLVSDRIRRWAAARGRGAQKQVANMGAGMDSRAFWDDSLDDVGLYYEVDEIAVNRMKETMLEDLEGRGELPKAVCERRVVSMNFEKESAKDLPGHGFDAGVPTCWILEGLVMYLTPDAIEGLYRELSGLSAHGSYLMINFAKPSHSAEAAGEILAELGWRLDGVVMFGDNEFNYGRYPEGKEPSKNLGFAFFTKEWYNQLLLRYRSNAKWH